MATPAAHWGGKSTDFESVDIPPRAAGGAAPKKPPMMNPYISARFGRFTKGEAVRRTESVKGGAANDQGRNVDFENVAHRTLLVPRVPNDGGVCYIDVWHDIGGTTGQHIGSTMIDIGELELAGIREDTLTLYDDGTKQEGAAPVGEVTFRMNWHMHGDVKKLAIQIERLKDLRDVSQLVVADADSFHDNQIMFRALSLFGVYLILGTICYDLYFRDCNDTAPTDMETNRMANGTANFIENNVNDVTNIEGNMEQLASDITDQGCTRVTSWTSFLDAMVFQFTSFTTVGFGTHPRNFEDDASMLLTVIYILSGMAIMGILAGAIGEAVVRQVELYTQRLAMMAEDSVEFTVSAGAAGVNMGVHAGGAALHGTANLVTAIVPVGSPRGDANVTGQGGLGAAEIAEMEREEEEEEKEEIREKKRKEYSPFKELLAASIGMFVIVLIGTFAYMKFDDRSFVEGMYFSVVTVTTVGFGDFAPESASAKVFSLFYVPIGVVMFASAINTVSFIPLQYRKIKLESYVLNQFEKHFSRYDLSVLKRSVDLSRNENMTKNDFSLAMLLRLGKIKAKDLERIEEVFFKLDADHSGYLDRADVDDLILKTEKRKEAEAEAEAQAEAEAASPSRPGKGGRVDRDIFEMEDGSGSTPSANWNRTAANGNGEEVGGVKNVTEAEGVESTGNPLQLGQTDAAAGAGGRQDSKDGAMDDT